MVLAGTMILFEKRSSKCCVSDFFCFTLQLSCKPSSAESSRHCGKRRSVMLFLSTVNLVSFIIAQEISIVVLTHTRGLLSLYLVQ